MEDLISQFTYLSNQALTDKNFDPSTIEVDLSNLFDLETYKAWAALELEQQNDLEETELALQEAETYLESVMESAMDEFRRFEEEMERMCEEEMASLIEAGEKARNAGKFMERAATIASNKYIEAALNSATASMRPAWKGVASYNGKKVHPVL